MHPKELSIEDFTYELPDEKIALFPASPRDSSRLLIYNEGSISEDIYRNLAQHLPADAVLIFNDTRVINSRILFPKSTGATIEIFCLEPFGAFADYDQLFAQTGESTWKCMIGKAGKWKEKQLVKTFKIQGRDVTLFAELTDRLPDSYLVRFTWTPSDFTVAEVIGAAGLTPLPPYIKRRATPTDEKTYQTVYSAHNGSVAAPTAGLHFTEEMMASFQERGITTLFTTLHVGAGTFKPVKSEKMGGHHMHAEWMNITLGFLHALRSNIHKKIISVGTTSTRTLESIYWMGSKIVNNPEIPISDIKIKQWEPYDANAGCSAEAALDALIRWMQARGDTHMLIETEIIIAPPYVFRIVAGLITNFHQPKSTLLLLVAALAGDGWKQIYKYALDHGFRFLSYGDGCLIIPQR